LSFESFSLGLTVDSGARIHSDNWCDLSWLCLMLSDVLSNNRI
jgi:hypothetical protein